MTQGIGEVIPWPLRTLPQDRLGVRHRIEAVLSLFRAIDAGELLAALPDCDFAKEQHCTALRLLALAEQELLRLHGEMETPG